MEIGPLSEWVTAIAETLAVSVALLLPYATSHHNSRERQKKIAMSIRHLAQEALEGKNFAKKDLSTFLEIGYFISDSEKERETLLIGAKILSLVTSPEKKENFDEIKKLLKELK